MSFKVRTNFSVFTHNHGKNNNIYATLPKTGKVFGVVTSENTPTEKQYKKVGGVNGIGAVFYLDYPNCKGETGSISDDFLDRCKIAFPLNPWMGSYPAVRELVLLTDSMNPSSQLSNTGRGIYYSNSIPVFNAPQQNSILLSKNESLGVDYPENPNIKILNQFAGDNIIQGGQGSAIRFSTTKLANRNNNEWSTFGKSIDPITIITNGFSYEKKEKSHIEKINKDLSSIYLTSYQKIPLQPDKTGIVNDATQPVEVSNYFYPQVIINGDRVVLNSKKDEVMIFAKTNIELNTKNTINLNADFRAHINSNQVFLGYFNPTNDVPEPVLLSYKVLRALEQIQISLTELGGYLNPVTSTKEGATIPNLNTAGRALIEDMIVLAEFINPDQLFSNKVYIAPNG